MADAFTAADPAADPAAEPATAVQRLAAELLGTLLLVFVGCGAFVSASLTDSGVDFLAIALAFGFALAVAVHAFGRISGGHFNPAVSVAAAMSGRLSWAHAGAYAGAQLVGAIVGAGLLFVVSRAIPEIARPTDFLGQSFYGDGGFAWWGALVVELLLSAVLVTIHLAVTDERNDSAGAPLTIGLTLAVLYLVTVPLTGGSLNPARSIGPALFAGSDAIKDLWLFVLVPLVAAAGAGAAYPALFGRVGEPVAGSGLNLTRPPKASPAFGGRYDGGYAPQGQGYPQHGYPPQGQAGHDDAAPVGQDWGPTTAGAQPAWGQDDQAPVDEQPGYEPEPIIQDGWQWDYQAQEWKPLEQWPAPTQVETLARAEPAAAALLDSDTASTDRRRGPGDPDVGREPWPDHDETVIRPRQP